QRHAVPAERLCDRPDVRPRTDAQVEERDPAVVADQVERVDDRAANGHLDLGTAAREAVGALAADLDGRVRRNRQLDLAAQACERSLELRTTLRLPRLELPFGIARRAH